MTVNEIRDRLVVELPDFQYTTGEEAGQPVQNLNSILVTRDGQMIAIDVSYVYGEKDFKELISFITKQWEKVT